MRTALGQLEERQRRGEEKTRTTRVNLFSDAIDR